MIVRPRTYRTATERWAGVGPYYAMFPAAFSDRVIGQYSNWGDVVIDPFAGRGTAVFSAASHGRRGIGIEINPVGWLYARTKLYPATRSRVVARLVEIASMSSDFKQDARRLPEFFHRCFSLDVRRFLVAAREVLDWRDSTVDGTLMTFLLIYLHGKKDAALSNQLRQTKAMSPQYAVRWWKRHRSEPPSVDPVAFLTKRLEWRYARGVPQVASSRVYRGDCLSILPKLESILGSEGVGRASLVLTSPPYRHLANYHYDQWLRLWMLGGAPNAGRNGKLHRGKFEGREDYERLLEEAFAGCKRLLRKSGVVYVRTSRRRETYKATIAALEKVFPDRRVLKRPRPFGRPTQTHLFGDASVKEAEVDLLLLPP